MALPVVAIVGRPNVGKSSLFNRLTRTRTSVVEDTPGVTRDRIYRRTQIDDKPFILIDTGGFIPESSNIIDSKVEKQIETAIKEADLLIFMVDAKDGILPEDERIADTLRKYGKKVIVAANKSDNPQRDEWGVEFYNLGFDEVIPISVLHNRNIDLLKDKIYELLPEEGKGVIKEGIKVAIVGKPNVGKSSLINAILGEERQIVSDIPGTTRDAVDIPVKFHGKLMTFIDTAGIRRKSRIGEKVEYYTVVRSIRSIERCDVAVCLLDSSQPITRQDYRILNIIYESYKPLIIFFNKSDLISPDERDRFIKEKMEELRFLSFASVMLGSAKIKRNLVKLQEEIFAVFKRSRQSFSSKVLNEIFIGPLSQHKHPMVNKRKVFIGKPRQVHTNPIVIQFETNIEPTKIMDSYVRYIDNVLREHVDLRGVPVKYTFKKR